MKACDVTKVEELQELVNFAHEKLGGIDILISNGALRRQSSLNLSICRHILSAFTAAAAKPGADPGMIPIIVIRFRSGTGVHVRLLEAVGARHQPDH